ncbi:MAG: (2Fe-2S)-binding protein [Acidobacteria bacterium]|nr:MAG: (2Fe-2S)-binding protein [Acidobacteriota bacterium]
MDPSLRKIIDKYDPAAPLAEAWTAPASWYVDPRVLELERQTVFAYSWQAVGRVEQVQKAGQYITWDLAGEPLVVVRGNDNVLRGFFNVCRHHAAAVVTESSSEAGHFKCPYHGWTYSLEGALKSTPDFSGVRNFDPASVSLAPVETAIWENWVFVKLEAGGPSLEEFLSDELSQRFRPLELRNLHWFERRVYGLECNWKVFVDNYLDGGYHVPHLHKALNSVLDYGEYTIENGGRFCLQSSRVVSGKGDPETGAVRTGDRAFYYWIYPNFMINLYEGVMDTNLVMPRGVNRTEVMFDFYFAGNSEQARNLRSVQVAERIQDEDAAICQSVQRGLASRSYAAGRLSVRREAGEHLFHKLLHADLQGG